MRTLPLYFDAFQQGHIDYNTAATRWVIDCASREPAIRERMNRVFERELQPQVLVPPGSALRMLAQAVVRGRFGVLPGFWKMARDNYLADREFKRRRKLAAASLACLQAAPYPAPRANERHAPQPTVQP